MNQQIQANNKQFQFMEQTVNKQFKGDQNSFYLENCNFNINLIGNENKMFCTSRGDKKTKNYLRIQGNGNYIAIAKPTFVTIIGNANEIEGDFANITVARIDGFGNTFPHRQQQKIKRFQPEIQSQPQVQKNRSSNALLRKNNFPFYKKQQADSIERFPPLFHQKKMNAKKQQIDFAQQFPPLPQKMKMNPKIYTNQKQFKGIQSPEIKKEHRNEPLQEELKSLQVQNEEYRQLMKKKFMANNFNTYSKQATLNPAQQKNNPFSNNSFSPPSQYIHPMQNGFNSMQNNPFQRNLNKNLFSYQKMQHPPSLDHKNQIGPFDRRKISLRNLTQYGMPPQFNNYQKKQINLQRRLSPEQMLPIRSQRYKKKQQIKQQTKKELETEPGPLSEADFEYIFVSNHQGKNVNCDICYQDITINSQQTFLYCFHNYHANCIKAWLKKDSRCPNCQLDIRKAIQQLKNQ